MPTDQFTHGFSVGTTLKASQPILTGVRVGAEFVVVKAVDGWLAGLLVDNEFSADSGDLANARYRY